VDVLPGAKGNIHTVARPQQPLKCTGKNSKDVLAQVSAKDKLFWQSDLSGDFQKDSDVRDGIILEFAKPPGATIAKLVVNGVNTRLGFFALEKVFQHPESQFPRGAWEPSSVTPIFIDRSLRQPAPFVLTLPEFIPTLRDSSR